MRPDSATTRPGTEAVNLTLIATPTKRQLRTANIKPYAGVAGCKSTQSVIAYNYPKSCRAMLQGPDPQNPALMLVLRNLHTQNAMKQLPRMCIPCHVMYKFYCCKVLQPQDGRADKSHHALSSLSKKVAGLEFGMFPIFGRADTTQTWFLLERTTLSGIGVTNSRNIDCAAFLC
jgi:hypothetical protein